MRISRKTAALIIGSSLVLLAVSMVLWRVLGGAGLVMALTLFSGSILLALACVHGHLKAQQTKHHHDLIEKTSHDYRQLEALSSLLWTLTPDLPLPRMRGWAASPDFLKELAEIILTTRPGLVVETGSGVSTLVAGYCLRRLGRGKIVSLDHDPKLAAATRATLALHDLQEIATVVDSPLTTVTVGGTPWRWYDTSSLRIDEPIDILVVAGPPGTTQALARYPAVPVFHGRLHDGSVILADDVKGEDERQIVSMWEREFGLAPDFVDTEAGACILRRRKPAGA
ncbi:MAG TPA: class I SAM-dependent methyltransferase [Sedimentisphaerales bacterium]|nr:class I SAM-dependent methyltransferase [Sedimentisphaerales bacterium]